MQRRLASVLVMLCACGNLPDPAKPTTSTVPDPASSGSASTPAASGDPDVVGDNAAKPRQRKPFTIHNACGEIVTVAFGEDPSAPGVGRRAIHPSSDIDGPRDVDGKATVSLLDAKGEPIAKVHITRGMKQLEIGRSCRTLDAR